MNSRALLQTRRVISSRYREQASGCGVTPIISAGFQSGITPRMVRSPSRRDVCAKRARKKDTMCPMFFRTTASVPSSQFCTLQTGRTCNRWMVSSEPMQNSMSRASWPQAVSTSVANSKRRRILRESKSSLPAPRYTETVLLTPTPLVMVSVRPIRHRS